MAELMTRAIWRLSVDGVTQPRQPESAATAHDGVAAVTCYKMHAGVGGGEISAAFYLPYRPPARFLCMGNKKNFLKVAKV